MEPVYKEGIVPDIYVRDGRVYRDVKVDKDTRNKIVRNTKKKYKQ